ncbi:antitoxin VbhA family protein [Pseudomonas helleri]|uniref:antitoxin VbhA family protein n=1 Tax=Pseudomonas helleri TaxID=1608996 RepID=UPI0030D8AFD3
MGDKPNFIDRGEAEPFPIFVTKQHDERAKRLRAVRFARASVGLEGFTLSEIDEENAKAYVDGEMTLDEFLRRSIPST